MPSKLSKAVPPFSRVVPQLGHRQGKGAPRAPFSTRLAPVPFYTPPANSCKGVPTRPVPPATGKGRPLPPPPLFPSQRGKLRVHWDGAPLRRNASCALAKGDGAALRRNAPAVPGKKGKLRFHRGGGPLRRNAPTVPGKKGKLRVHRNGATLCRDASRASFPLLKGEASLPQGWRALAPKRFLRPNKEDGAALRRDASRAFFPLSKGNLPIPQETARPCAETPRPFPVK